MSQDWLLLVTLCALVLVLGMIQNCEGDRMELDSFNKCVEAGQAAEDCAEALP